MTNKSLIFEKLTVIFSSLLVNVELELQHSHSRCKHTIWKVDNKILTLRTMGDFTFDLRLSLSQFAERKLKLNAKDRT